METNQTLNVGDVCLDCQQLGLEKHLRYFKLNLNGDTLLKCESNECMYPYNDEMSSSSDEEQDGNRNLVERNSLKFIDDFIQQYNNENEVQNSTNDLISNPNITEQTTHFDISFLDNFQEINNENSNETEFQIQSVEFFDNKQNVKITENQIISLSNSNENLHKQEFTIEHLKLLDNKSNEEIIDNQFISSPSLNSPKYEITTAVVEESSYHDNDNGIISYITFTDDSVKDYKQKIDIQSIETAVLEQNSNQRNYNQIVSFITLMDDNVKDCKPKIDIQSIETIKMESPLYNILPTSSNSNIITENSSNNDNSSLTITTTTKSASKSETLKKYSVTSKKSSNISLDIPTSSQLSRTSDKSPPNTAPFDIPKANILKGSDLLKKLALADEKTSKLNIKMKAARNNKKVANKAVTKKAEELAPPPSISDSDFSLDKLSEILTTNKMKRESKNE